MGLVLVNAHFFRPVVALNVMRPRVAGSRSALRRLADGRTGIDVGAEDFPVGSVDVEVRGGELAGEMRRGHGALHVALESCRAGEIKRLRRSRPVWACEKRLAMVATSRRSLA